MPLTTQCNVVFLDSYWSKKKHLSTTEYIWKHIFYKALK